MWKTFISLWKNIFNYSGTASRKEFWLGSIMNIIAMYVGLLPIAILFLLLNTFGVLHLISPIAFSIIYICIFLLPLLSLYVRRANDVGLKKFDIWLVAVAVPAAGAMIIAMYPPKTKVLYKGVAWCYRCMAIGFGFYIYSGFIGSMVLGSIDAAAPFVGIGLALATISMIIGAIIVKVNQERNRNN